MEDNTQYFKDPPKLIYELMQDTFGSKFTYFLGSPTMIANTAYPICVVQPMASNNTVTGAATGQDLVTQRISIFFFMLDTGAQMVSTSENTTMRELYELIEGRDPATGFYMKTSALYALRTNLSLINPKTNQPTVIDQDVDVDYDVIREENQQDKMAAVITITTSERVNVPDRL